jgi:hypothetical protein
VAGVVPCNAVLREIASGRISVEFAAPSAVMGVLGDARLTEMAVGADARIKKALANA